MARKARSAAEKKADVQLGRRLAQIRKERGYTQVELAEQVGVMQTIISDYERGRLRVNPTMLAKLATVLEVSADEILGLASPKRSPQPANRRFLRRLHALAELPKRDQEALLRTIDAFLAARQAS